MGQGPHRRFIERIVALAAPFFRRGVFSSPTVAGKLRPLASRHNEVLLAPGGGEEAPPARLWAGYADNAEDYLAEGRTDMELVLDLLARNAIAQPRVVLDLGCAAGRMIRHYPRDGDPELWGADISAVHIVWCQQNLADINFFISTTAPHLPFPDGYFDFVMCASVFTHITDLADAWFLEIRRVLKPGGHLYLTVHDKISYQELLTKYAETGTPAFVEQVKDFERRHHPLQSDYDLFYFGADPESQVFYDRDYIVRKWSKWMPAVAFEGQTHDYQSAILFQKPAEHAEFIASNDQAADGLLVDRPMRAKVG